MNESLSSARRELLAQLPVPLSRAEVVRLRWSLRAKLLADTADTAE